MCGLVGEVTNGQAIDYSTLEQMLQRVAHRGPDDRGFYTDRQGDVEVALGSRRLKIIDLSAMGAMPMSNQRGDISLVYNGEIYNHQELRGELEARGCQYRSTTDTETVIYAYQEYGLEALRRFNGIFAFALYDQRKRRLVLARDRMGVKPLYYYWDGTRLIFASELKAMLVHPEVAHRVDHTATDLYLSFGYVPAPYSMIEGVHKLEPGQVLVFEGGVVNCHYFWQPHLEPDPSPRSDAELVPRTRHLLESAVSSQMMSDVPVGTLLSGGVDSSIVTALAARNHSGPIDTFAVGFAGQGDNTPEACYNEDLFYARQVADALSTRHHEVVLKPGAELTDLAYQLGAGLDEPVWEGSYISIYSLAQAASQQGVKVLLTGDGGDELFAGYPWYLGYRRLARYKPFQPLVGMLNWSAERHLFDLWPQQRERVRTVNQMLSADEVGRYRISHDIFGAAQKRQLLHGTGEAGEAVVGRILERLLAGSQGTSVDLVGLLDTSLWLREHFSQRLDRMTMLNSVEARVPLQDNRLVDFAFSLTEQQKMPHGQLKHLLRASCADLLPQAVMNRPKRPFAVPSDWWLRHALRDFALDNLSHRSVARHGLLDPARTEALARDYIVDGRGSGAQIWALLNLQIWCDAYLLSPQVSPNPTPCPAFSSELVGAWR